MKTTIWVVTLCCTLIVAYPARSADFTLSDPAIMSLDYNLQDAYLPPITASVTLKQDIPGTGVQYTFHFNGTNTMDSFIFQVSDATHGAGTLAGLNVSAYANFDLKFTLVSVDGSTSGTQRLEAGALIGPFNSSAWAYHPEIISLTGASPSSAVSPIPVTWPTISDIGINVNLWPYGGWSAGPHDVTLLVQPAPGVVQIPEPSTLALVCLSGLVLLGLRPGCRKLRPV